ncbi:prevent-host-death protein [Terracidiphilus sp.]|jgi:antitoxin (DNA-binding transcriptional repressor) of toxin-antitoxin stability system|uniref:prevent-host-death protein n=1 Tax=Terracidiphilus sp. TaxID=1964191 RepID=UPI003C18AFA1
MRLVSLREFRTRGAKALEKVPKGETVLLTGQKGPAYFLVPAMGDIAAQEDDLQTAIARASLREDWEVAKTLPPITDEEIEQEIRAYRAEQAAQELLKSA